MWKYLIFGATYAFASAVQPGPLQTCLLSETLSRGWRRTLPAAFAPLLSDLPIIAVALFGLSRIPGDFVGFLHIAGALFLFYLSWRAFQTWHDYDTGSEEDISGGRPPLFKAIFVNLLNPNPWLGWSLVMGPLFLEGYREAPRNGMALISGFYGTMVICLGGIIMLFAFAGRLGPRVRKILLGLSVLALGFFGVYQLLLGIRAVGR
jgi:threonine/homoserine/homoserine lactone efflux protein